MSDANRMLGMSFIDTINSHDPDKVMAMFAPDPRIVIMLDPALLPIPAHFDGFAAVRKYFADAYALYESHLIFKSALVDGDRIAIEAASDTVLPGGRPYKNDYVYMLDLRDGKIVEMRTYMDNLVTKETIAYFQSLAK